MWPLESTFLQAFRSVLGCQTCMCKRGIKLYCCRYEPLPLLDNNESSEDEEAPSISVNDEPQKTFEIDQGQFNMLKSRLG